MSGKDLLKNLWLLIEPQLKQKKGKEMPKKRDVEQESYKKVTFSVV